LAPERALAACKKTAAQIPRVQF